MAGGTTSANSRRAGDSGRDQNNLAAIEEEVREDLNALWRGDRF